MGDLDPKKVRAAVLRGLMPVERRISALKNKSAAAAWGRFNKDATHKLLRGDITVDEWKGALAQFGGIVTKGVKDPATQQALAEDVNNAAIIVEEAFEPPSPLGWLIFAGVAATGFAYWWMKREEGEKKEIPIFVPEVAGGTQRKGRKFPTAEIEEVEAEFEEI